MLSLPDPEGIGPLQLQRPLEQRAHKNKEKPCSFHGAVGTELPPSGIVQSLESLRLRQSQGVLLGTCDPQPKDHHLMQSQQNAKQLMKIDCHPIQLHAQNDATLVDEHFGVPPPRALMLPEASGSAQFQSSDRIAHLELKQKDLSLLCLATPKLKDPNSIDLDFLKPCCRFLPNN
jgi:hypothetical protein